MSWWCYCDGCRPAGAELIPAGEPFYTLHLVAELELAVSQDLESEAAAAALRLLEQTVRDAGGRLRVARARLRHTPAAAALVAPLRLTLAGDIPVTTDARSSFLEQRGGPPMYRNRGRRAS